MVSSQKTVSLDVGGAKYKVSRSLIEAYPGTMLAKLINETWHQNPEEEIFIDRNGLRFQYILDYMRDQKAYLGINVSAASVLKDLEYFGFENVSGDAIVAGTATVEAVEHIMMVHKDEKELFASRQEELDTLKMAYECFAAFSQDGALTITIIRETMKEKGMESAYNNLSVSAPLNSCLKKYALRIKGVARSGAYKVVQLEKLSPVH